MIVLDVSFLRGESGVFSFRTSIVIISAACLTALTAVAVAQAPPQPAQPKANPPAQSQPRTPPPPPRAAPAKKAAPAAAAPRPPQLFRLPPATVLGGVVCADCKAALRPRIAIAAVGLPESPARLPENSNGGAELKRTSPATWAALKTAYDAVSNERVDALKKQVGAIPGVTLVEPGPVETAWKQMARANRRTVADPGADILLLVGAIAPERRAPLAYEANRMEQTAQEHALRQQAANASQRAAYLRETIPQQDMHLQREQANLITIEQRYSSCISNRRAELNRHANRGDAAGLLGVGVTMALPGCGDAREEVDRQRRFVEAIARERDNMGAELRSTSQRASDLYRQAASEAALGVPYRHRLFVIPSDLAITFSLTQDRTWPLAHETSVGFGKGDFQREQLERVSNGSGRPDSQAAIATIAQSLRAPASSTTEWLQQAVAEIEKLRKTVRILEVRPNDIILAAGAQQGVQVGDVFSLVSGPVEVKPATLTPDGRRIPAETKAVAAEAQVIEVTPQTAIAKVIRLDPELLAKMPAEGLPLSQWRELEPVWVRRLAPPTAPPAPAQQTAPAQKTAPVRIP
jgi:hypothetical protein